MRKYIFIILLFYINVSFGQKKYFIQPDYAKIQFAGNIGVFSTGIGYKFISGKIESDLLYGYVPMSLGGADIHVIANKNNFRIFQIPLSAKISFSHSAGFSTNLYITNHTFIFLPKHYPKNYYEPNAIHFAPLLSYNFIFKENLKLFNNLNLYFELSTLDSYIWFYLNSTAFRFTEIWNLGIGTSLQFVY